MSAQTATGPVTVIAEGFIALGESDKSEGRGPRVELGRFTTVEEAIHAARGQGVQGDPGAVASYRYLLHAGGAVTEERARLIERRRVPDGRYLVGWLDLREYTDDPATHTGPTTPASPTAAPTTAAPAPEETR